jgi:hypothetical protein
MPKSFGLERIQCACDSLRPEPGARHAEPLGELVGCQGTVRLKRGQHPADGGRQLPRRVGELGGGLLVDVLGEVPRERPAVGPRYGEDQVSRVASGRQLPADGSATWGASGTGRTTR